MAELVSHRDQVANLLATYRTKDPRLVQIIETLMDDLHDTIVTVNPIKEAVTASGIGDTTPPDNISVINVTLLPFSILIEWASVAGASLYEIRQGSSWDSATFILNTTSLAASLNPLPTGSHDYLIKSISVSGIYSIDPIAFQIVVPPLGLMTLTSSVIDNNVLLYWTLPTSSFFIDHYNLYRDSNLLGEVKGTFASRFEVVSGTYIYEVEAVDIVGNVSPKASTSASVRQPPDYTLLFSRLIDWSATKTNCAIVNIDGVNKLVACVDVVETYENHFLNGPGGPWSSPQAQVTAGYERYIQENLLTGSYEEDYDYGAVINNVIVNYLYVKEIFSGTGDVTVELKTYYKLNIGDAWTGPLNGPSAFITSFRYLRSIMEFSALNDDSMIAVSSFYIKVDVKREVDSGWVDVLASDTTGTVVNFTKTFKDVDGIECTADSVSPITVIVDFVDVPDPTSFKILCFDSAGRRVDQLVYWIARGIV